MERYDPASSIGWLHHLHHVWPQQEAQYYWLEYLCLEAQELRRGLPPVPTTQEELEREEQWYCVMEEFTIQLESITSDEQRTFVMNNLPFDKRLSSKSSDGPQEV